MEWLEELINLDGEKRKAIEEAGGLIESPMSFEEMFMRQVYLVAAKSKDPSSKIGSVLVKDNNIVSIGYNGFGMGVLDLKDRYNDRETKYSFIVHAEMNSILAAAKRGSSTEGGVLYTNYIPCCECGKAIIQAGIQTVICHKQFPPMNHSEKWTRGYVLTTTMFQEAGVEMIWLDKVLGVKGFVGGKEIAV